MTDLSPRMCNGRVFSPSNFCFAGSFRGFKCSPVSGGESWRFADAQRWDKILLVYTSALLSHLG